MEVPESERTAVAAAAEGRLTGKTYVITGTLASMPREQAEAALKRLGAKVSSGVSKKTTGVIVGAEPGSKADKARALGVPILDDEAFLQLIGPS